jgi:hypothetical protein
MGYCRLGLAVAVTFSLFFAVKSEPAAAGSVAASALTRTSQAVALGTAQMSPRLSVHFRRQQSFYCLPRNYWWFYRPYTTAQENNPRCMPYFHYLEQPSYRRGANSDRVIK